MISYQFPDEDAYVFDDFEEIPLEDREDYFDPDEETDVISSVLQNVMDASASQSVAKIFMEVISSPLLFDLQLAAGNGCVSREELIEICNTALVFLKEDSDVRFELEAFERRVRKSGLIEKGSEDFAILTDWLRENLGASVEGALWLHQEVFDGEAGVIGVFDGKTYLLGPGTLRIINSTLDEIHRISRKSGVVSIDEVIRRINTADLKRSGLMINEVLRLSEELSPVSESVWMNKSLRQSYFSLIMGKVFSVANRVSKAELIEVISNRSRGRLPRLREIDIDRVLRDFDYLDVQPGEVLKKFELSETYLSESEKILRNMMSVNGPCHTKSHLISFSSKMGIGEHNLRSLLSNSPIVKRISQGKYALIGSFRSSSEDQPANDNVAEVCCSIHPSASSVQNGVVRLPSFLKMVTSGKYQVFTSNGVDLGSLLVRNGCLSGLRKLFSKHGFSTKKAVHFTFEEGKIMVSQ